MLNKDFCSFFGRGLRGAGCGLMRAGKKAFGPRAGGLRARPEYISTSQSVNGAARGNTGAQTTFTEVSVWRRRRRKDINRNGLSSTDHGRANPLRRASAVRVGDAETLAAIAGGGGGRGAYEFGAIESRREKKISEVKQLRKRILLRRDFLKQFVQFPFAALLFLLLWFGAVCSTIGQTGKNCWCWNIQ